MGKINGNMNILELGSTMAGNNPGAWSVVVQMLNRGMLFDLLLCDDLEIRGPKLYMLNNDCCSRDSGKFARTLMMIRCGAFPRKQIHDNLELVRAIPFIDDAIQIEGVPGYDEPFDPTHSLWEPYVEEQKKSFTDRLNKIMKERSERG